MCEEQLKQNMAEFNNSMGSKGFKVEYKVLDKTPIGIIYGLTMNYHQIFIKSEQTFFSAQCMFLRKL